MLTTLFTSFRSVFSTGFLHLEFKQNTEVHKEIEEEDWQIMK